MNSQLIYGEIIHQRHMPKPYRIKQKYNSMMLDLDELSQLTALSKLFRRNRWSLMSFYDADYGFSGTQSVEQFIHDLLDQCSISKPSRIRLLCGVRSLFFVFNPLCVWLCENEKGETETLIYEVKNTKGEKHHYIVDLKNNGNESTTKNVHRVDKMMYVSPFSMTDGQYEFSIKESDRYFSLLIKHYVHGEKHFSALWRGSKTEISKVNLRAYIIGSLMGSYKVVLGIHWHALRLFIASFPWYPFKAQPNSPVSMTSMHKDNCSEEKL